MARKEMVKAVAYLRTSSAANVGADKDSEKRQRAAIEAFARAAGMGLPQPRPDCNGERRSLREISQALDAMGYRTSSGKPYAAAAIAKMVGA